MAEALRLGRLWRRLAEQRGWAPLADADTLRQLLAQLGCPAPAEEALADWLGRFGGRGAARGLGGGRCDGRGAARLAPGGAGGPGVGGVGAGEGRGDRLSTAALFLAAGRLAPRRERTIRRQCGHADLSALPLWSAMPRHLERLALAAGPAWLGGFLTTVTDAAQRAGQDLTRLQSAAARAAALRRTARSHLPAAAALALRQPVLTARGLAERLRLSPQAALGLLNQLVAAGVLK